MAIERRRQRGHGLDHRRGRIADVVDRRRRRDLPRARAAASRPRACCTARPTRSAASTRSSSSSGTRTADELRFPGAPRGDQVRARREPQALERRQLRRPLPRHAHGRRGGLLPRVLARARVRARSGRRTKRRARAARIPSRRAATCGSRRWPGSSRARSHVHSHCYRADEILMLLRAAEHFGFRIADAAARARGLQGRPRDRRRTARARRPSATGGRTRSRPTTRSRTTRRCSTRPARSTSLNSDSDEMMRRLYGEAAKSRALRRHGPRARARAGHAEPGEAARHRRARRLDRSRARTPTSCSSSGDPLSSLRARAVDDGRRRDRVRAARRLRARVAAAAGHADRGARARLDRSRSIARGESVAFVGGTLHPITAPDVEGGTLLVRGERIVAMGKGVPIPAGARVIDVTGQHVWPGIDRARHAARTVRDRRRCAAPTTWREIGGNQPDIRASASLYAESAHIAGDALERHHARADRRRRAAVR